MGAYCIGAMPQVPAIIMICHPFVSGDDFVMKVMV
jgi:hypothetical protein